VIVTVNYTRRDRGLSAHQTATGTGSAYVMMPPPGFVVEM
jgi:hypothetical protein